MAVEQSILETVAKRGNYVINVNPRQVLINKVGIDGYSGGGNLRVGDSAANLDRLINQLEQLPRARFELDTGTFYEHWTPMTLADVRRLRAAFFALYGLGKPNWYGPPLYPPQPQPRGLIVDDQSGTKEFLIMLESGPDVIVDAYLATD